jgi:hypothetical protein
MKVFSILCFLAGVVIGGIIFGARPVRAQSDESKAYVTHLATGSGSTNVPGKQVVGISCVRQPEFANTECFVVSQ